MGNGTSSDDGGGSSKIGIEPVKTPTKNDDCRAAEGTSTPGSSGRSLFNRSKNPNGTWCYYNNVT